MPTHEQLNSPTKYVSAPASSLSPRMKSAVQMSGSGVPSMPSTGMIFGMSALKFAISALNCGSSGVYDTYFAPEASVAEMPPSAGFLWMISVGVS